MEPKCLGIVTYSITLAFHANLLEGHHILRVDMDALEDFAIRARTNNGLVSWFSIID